MISPSHDSWVKEGLLPQLLYHSLQLQAQCPSEILEKVCDDAQKAIEEGVKAISLKSNAECFLKRCEPLTGHLSQYVAACPPDENLDFFLLRHQEECKKAFGRFFLLNLFKKKHRGIKETQNFLLETFQKRGFFHLTPSILKNIAGLTK